MSRHLEHEKLLVMSFTSLVMIVWVWLWVGFEGIRFMNAHYDLIHRVELLVMGFLRKEGTGAQNHETPQKEL